MIKYTMVFWGCLMAWGAFSQAVLVDKVIAKVGDEVIFLSELEEQVSYLRQMNKKFNEEDVCGVLDELMLQALLVHKAKLDSVEVADVEVEGQLQSRIDRTLSMMNNNIKQFEEYYGKTVNEMKDELRESLKNQLLAQRMQQTIMSDVTVTPSEVKDFFRKIPKDSLPYFGSEVELAEIVINPGVSDAEKEKARLYLEDIRKRIVEDGKDFGEMASKYSEDPGSARAKGSLGWTKRGTFVPEFEAVVYNSDLKEVSDVFESEYGFHILEVLERRGNNVLVRHILIKSVIKNEDEKKAYDRLAFVRSILEKDSISFEAAVKQYSSDKVQSYTNSGRMINPMTGNTFYQIDQLNPDEYFAIDTLEVNQITMPFEVIDPRDGSKSYKIIKLLTRTNPHKASLKEDYSKIRAAAIEQRKSIYIDQWLENNLKFTYIWVDKKLASCPEMDKWKESNAYSSNE